MCYSVEQAFAYAWCVECKSCLRIIQQDRQWHAFSQTFLVLTLALGMWPWSWSWGLWHWPWSWRSWPWPWGLWPCEHHWSSLYVYWRRLSDHLSVRHAVSVPREDPSGHTLVISAADFVRIKNAARVTSEQERQAAAEKLKEEKERALVTEQIRVLTLCILAIV